MACETDIRKIPQRMVGDMARVVTTRPPIINLAAKGFQGSMMNRPNTQPQTTQR